MTVSVRGEVPLAVHPPTVGLLAQSAVLTALAAGVGLGPAGWLVGTAFAVTSWVLLTRVRQRPGVPRWSPADTVTLARTTLAGGVAALVADSFTGPVPVAVLVTLAAVALALDAVDGKVARRTGSTSPLGARFDMEADSFLALVLSVYVAAALGWWVLAIGGFRYVFGVACWALPWLAGPLPPRWSRKAVAAAQGIVLVVAAAGVLPTPAVTGAVGLSLVVLCWSFALDVRWRWQVRQLTWSLGWPELAAAPEHPPVVPVAGRAGPGQRPGVVDGDTQ